MYVLYLITEHIRHVNDPEHPLSLEQLNVVSLDNVTVSDQLSTVHIYFTPTIPHCSMATLIGLSLRVKLLRSLPPRYKISIAISPGTHQSEEAGKNMVTEEMKMCAKFTFTYVPSVNKQLNDKERVAAALENAHLLDIVNKCISHTDQ